MIPVGICLLKVNNKNTRTRCEICSKLTRKIPEQRQSLGLVYEMQKLVRKQKKNKHKKQH